MKWLVFTISLPILLLYFCLARRRHRAAATLPSSAHELGEDSGHGRDGDEGVHGFPRLLRRRAHEGKTRPRTVACNPEKLADLRWQ